MIPPTSPFGAPYEFSQRLCRKSLTLFTGAVNTVQRRNLVKDALTRLLVKAVSNTHFAANINVRLLW